MSPHANWTACVIDIWAHMIRSFTRYSKMHGNYFIIGVLIHCTQSPPPLSSLSFLTHSLTYSLTHSLTHSHTHSLTHSHTHSLTHTHTHTLSLSLSLSHTLTHLIYLYKTQMHTPNIHLPHTPHIPTRSHFFCLPILRHTYTTDTSHFPQLQAGAGRQTATPRAHNTQGKRTLIKFPCKQNN